jgi:SAM-dependent methyltransferase
MVARDSDYFQELQTHTGWGRTLYGFAVWCAPQPGYLTLDIGCGPGLLPSIFSQMGCRSLGIDLDLEMFKPSPLHTMVAVADVDALPFKRDAFDLITASNLVFLLAEPINALVKVKQLLRSGGRLAMLNLSENLHRQSASDFADERGLEGIARHTLLNWAARAEQHHRWTDDETSALYTEAGMNYQESVLKIGPGFGRFSSGIA